MERKTTFKRRNKSAFVVAKASAATWVVAFSRRMIPGALFNSKDAALSSATMLAKSWMELEAANLMVFKAAALYDAGEPCGLEANSAKYLAGEACFRACEAAVMAHGGMGYAKEYHVERFLREALIPRIAPVSPELILCFIAEKALGLPKSY